MTPPSGLWLLSDSNPDREVLWRLGALEWAPDLHRAAHAPAVTPLPRSTNSAYNVITCRIWDRASPLSRAAFPFQG